MLWSAMKSGLSVDRCVLVDRAKRTGASGTRLKESININQGLLTLGKVRRLSSHHVDPQLQLHMTCQVP
jgi:hypothetical protein